MLFILSLIPGAGSTESELYYRTNDKLDISSYEYKVKAPETEPPTLVNLGDSTRKVMALYLMPAAACGNCLNEVNEYVGLLKDEYSNLGLDQIIWFHGETERYARQFAIISDFQLPTVYSVSNFLPPRLTAFKNESIDSQLIVINKADEQVLFRVQLPKGAMTPVEVKEVMLNELTSLLESHTP